jgi:hypothetical protein
MVSRPSARAVVEVPAEAVGHPDELVGGVLEGDVEAAFSVGESFGDEPQRADGLADPGLAQDQDAVAAGNSAAGQFPQAGDATLQTAGEHGHHGGHERLDAREHDESVGAQVEGVFALQVGSAAKFDHPQPAPVDRFTGLVGQLRTPSATANSGPLSITMPD